MTDKYFKVLNKLGLGNCIKIARLLGGGTNHRLILICFSR